MLLMVTEEEKVKNEANLEVFMEQFGDSLQLMANIYCDRREERGDGWNDMSVEDIAGRMFEEFTEWVKEYNDKMPVRQVAEAVDVANFALMFIEAGGKSIQAVVKQRSLERATVQRSAAGRAY